MARGIKNRSTNMRWLLTILFPMVTQAQDVPLKDYIDKQIEFVIKIADIRYSNVESNVATAKAALEKRLDGLNEFRGQLSDQVATFPTRKELWGYLVAVVGLLFGYANYKKNIEQSKSSGSVIRSGDNVEVKK